MKHMIGKFLLTSALVATLTACGGDDNNPSPPAPTPPPVGVTPPPVATPPPSNTPPPATPGTIAARFGAAFAAIFGTTANAEPKDPAPSDLGAVNTTSDPIDF